ncbi:MAG: HEAT repeat domain-containing protein, partial [Planctomycetes bacterium]|nr:HEAT repeat domain-containing protein [Planctomycetota bacterium]
MTRKRKFFSLIFFLILCLLVIVIWQVKNSPTNQARRLIAELNREKSAPSRFIKLLRRIGIRVNSTSRDYDIIIQDLVDLGEPAFPVLIETLIEDEEYILKLHVSEVFEIHGSNARSAVPDLIEIITTTDDFSIQTIVAVSLSAIGPDAVDPVVELLGDQNPRHQVLAAGALIEIDHNIQNKPEIIKVCVSAITDSNLNTRVHAFQVLSMLGPDAEPAIGAIIEALKDPLRRGIAAYTLRRIGHSAIPYLLKIIDTPDPEIVSVVIEILVDIDPIFTAEEIFPTLLQHLSSDHPDLQKQVLLALQFKNPPPIEILPSLQKILQTEDPEILLPALDLIESIGPPAAASVFELIQIIENQTPEARIAALNAITSIGSAA